jgi:hypothetical protein
LFRIVSSHKHSEHWLLPICNCISNHGIPLERAGISEGLGKDNKMYFRASRRWLSLSTIGLSRVLAHRLRSGELLAPGAHQLPQQVRTSVVDQTEALSRVAVRTNNLQCWFAVVLGDGQLTRETKLDGRSILAAQELLADEGKIKIEGTPKDEFAVSPQGTQ